MLLLWGTADQVVTEAGHQLVLDAAPGPICRVGRNDGRRVKVSTTWRLGKTWDLLPHFEAGWWFGTVFFP